MLIGIDASRANVVRRTGTERYAWEVIRRLLASLPGQQIRLYVREPLLPDWPPLGDDVQVRVLGWPPEVLWSHLRLSWELLWHSPDVLFVPADTVPIIHPVRTVTTIHDVAFERFPELYRGVTVQRKMRCLRPFVGLAVRLATGGKYGPSERDYHHWSVRHALRSCGMIMTVSEFTKQEIIRIFHVKPGKIVVTPPGLNLPAGAAAVTPAMITAAQVKFNLRRPYLFFVGRLETKKNIKLLVEAYHRYRTNTPNPVDLVLIGPAGYGWETVAEYITSNKLTEVIHVLGWQPDNLSQPLHAGARALVFISQYEGFGLPAVESLALGVPVLASRHGSLPEVLGPAAYYVDTTVKQVATGMIKITTAHEIRQNLIASGKMRAGLYSWDSTAEQTKKVLLNQPLP